MMEGASDVSALKMLNHELVKLDRFDGTNFSRWKDKMKFLLTTLKLFYVLGPNLMPFPLANDEDIDEIKAQRKKWEEDGLICRGQILNTLSDHLYDLYTSMKSPKEIWNTLEAKYKTEKIGTNKFIIQKYFDYKMLDNVSVLDQVYELQILVNKLRDLSINIPESFQVGAITAKLPPNWYNFRKKLLLMSEDLTLEEFEQHLRIKEESWVKDVTNTNSKVNVNNVSNVQSESSNKTNKHLKVNKNGSGFKKNNSKNPNKDKKNRACFHCGKKDHYIRECKLLKNKKNDEEGNAIEMNVIVDIVAMITEVHMAVIANPFDWWFDLGATMHVCNKKEQYKTYDESSIEQQVLMDNHNKTKVLGKGTVEVNLCSGKMMILTNIFHVPDIKKNLVSANLLYKSGIKAVLESDKLTLSKNVILVGKGYATDGMYKLSIINKEVSGCAYIIDSSYLWHARLGLLNFKYLKFMPKHMISYKHDDEKKFEICIQVKMTKKPFSKPDRNSILLELVHSDVCELNGVLTRGSKRYFITFIKMNHLTCSNVIKLK